jgi:CHAT domain-containing protein
VAAAPVRKGEATPSAATSAADKMVEEIGAELFSFLFSEIQDLFVKSLAKADKLQRPLFIRLCVTHPDLAAVPWEALYEPKKRSYVSTSEVTPLIRSVDLNQGKGIPPGEGPLRILVMASRVRTLRGVMIDSLEVDDELDMIKAALESLGKRVSFELVPSAKPRDLGRSLKTGEGEDGNRWDIFHFIGHGGYDADRRMGYIVVQELGGPKGEKLYTQDLKQYLVKPGKTPSLVVLNSCSGAAEQKGQLFSSTAAELIQAGIPAVVAMQFEVSDDMGKEFAASFYGYLADGYSIQDALTATRLDLKFKGFSEWITPVLYMQSTDPGVFRPRKTAASGAAPRQ